MHRTVTFSLTAHLLYFYIFLNSFVFVSFGMIDIINKYSQGYSVFQGQF